MNAMIDAAGRPAEAWRQDAPVQSEPGGGAVFTLRRTGRKPVRFEGWQLVEAEGARLPTNSQTDPSPSLYVRHDLNIYRTVKGGVVVELIARRHSPEHQDLFRVKTFEDLSGAATWLENHHAAEDVPIPEHLGSAESGLTWAVLQAVQLRQCIDRIEANYQALLSEVFAALDLSELADV